MSDQELRKQIREVSAAIEEQVTKVRKIKGLAIARLATLQNSATVKSLLDEENDTLEKLQQWVNEIRDAATAIGGLSQEKSNLAAEANAS
ncbi:MAG: hypothetical protein SF069_03015 [Phycisphaerae bacterium]|nr:hypothetical protein [Phycisphaerae bacterium]